MFLAQRGTNLSVQITLPVKQAHVQTVTLVHVSLHVLDFLTAYRAIAITTNN